MQISLSINSLCLESCGNEIFCREKKRERERKKERSILQLYKVMGTKLCEKLFLRSIRYICFRNISYHTYTNVFTFFFFSFSPPHIQKHKITLTISFKILEFLESELKLLQITYELFQEHDNIEWTNVSYKFYLRYIFSLFCHKDLQTTIDYCYSGDSIQLHGGSSHNNIKSNKNSNFPASSSQQKF